MRKRKRKSPIKACLAALFLALAVLAGPRAAAAEAVIHLRNGDRITGQIKSETATEITVQTGSLGLVAIPIGEIARREEKSTVAAPSAPTPQGAATNAPAAAPTPAPAATPPVAATPAPKPKPAAPKRWNSEIQFGLNLRYSTKDQQEALVIAKSTYAKDRLREILDYSFNHGQINGVQSANRMNGSSKTEYDLSPRVYAFGLGGASYDEIRRIDRQFEVNPGIGYQWLKTPDLVLKTEVGFGYQDQFYSNGREVNSFSGRLAGIYTWRIWDKLMADGRMEYFPNVEAFNQYRFRFESTLRYPLMKNLSLNMILIDVYDTQSPPNVDHNDLQIRSAIGVKF